MSYLPYLKVEQMNFYIQFWKQCCSVMHNWRNFNNVEFESIMVILYDKVWLQSYTPKLGHSIPLFQGSVFFLGRTVYLRPTYVSFLATTERSMINATTRERRFERQTRFDYGYWNVFLPVAAPGGGGGHGGQMPPPPPVRGFAPPVRMGFFFFFFFLLFLLFFFTFFLLCLLTSHQFKINISIFCNISFYK